MHTFSCKKQIKSGYVNLTSALIQSADVEQMKGNEIKCNVEVYFKRGEVVRFWGVMYVRSFPVKCYDILADRFLTDDEFKEYFITENDTVRISHIEQRRRDKNICAAACEELNPGSRFALSYIDNDGVEHLTKSTFIVEGVNGYGIKFETI